LSNVYSSNAAKVESSVRSHFSHLDSVLLNASSSVKLYIFRFSLVFSSSGSCVPLDVMAFVHITVSVSRSQTESMVVVRASKGFKRRKPPKVI